MKKLIPIIVISALVAALVTGSVAWGVTHKPAPAKEDFSFVANRRMTLEELRDIATQYSKDKTGINLDTLKKYLGHDMSSSTSEYLMEYYTDSGYGLSVYADLDKTITAMYIRRVEDGEIMKINGETGEHIDDFIGGNWIPTYSEKFWNTENFCSAEYNQEGVKYAWEHADNPNLLYIGSRQYLPATSFSDKESFVEYIRNGAEFYEFDKEMIKKYDQAFFEENRVILIYISGYYGSVSNIAVKNGIATFVIGGGEYGTEETKAGFIVVECSKQATEDITDYQAVG